MHVEFSPEFLVTEKGQEAAALLKSCVHCGFCLATCPTYQLLGDEQDSPRGRLYLMKGMWEGQIVTKRTQLHLDRCLTCRACETTCPSGVQYGKLLDLAREQVERQVERSSWRRLNRQGLGYFLSRRGWVRFAVGMGRFFRPLLPDVLKARVPKWSATQATWPTLRHSRRMVVLDGCVQPTLAPQINVAAARVLDRWGITLERVQGEGCCGALSHHLGDHESSMMAAKRNVDAWWPLVEQGIEAIVVTASGCGSQVKDYGYLLRHEPGYVEKGKHVASLARDVSEVVAAELDKLGEQALGEIRGALGQDALPVVFQSPCSLQHGQKLGGHVERLLESLGVVLTPVPEPHLCCGSAGTYSLLQPLISGQLRQRKLKALRSGNPTRILTANIGCQEHLAQEAQVPVQHWIVWLDEKFSNLFINCI